mgnify:FL=1
MKATLSFTNRKDAQKFATLWSRRSLMGYVLGNTENGASVDVYDITPALKDWIDEYVKEEN